MKKNLLISGFVCSRRIFDPLLPLLDDYDYLDINTLKLPENLDIFAEQFGHQQIQNIIAYSCGALLGLKLLEHGITCRLIAINSTPYFMAQVNWSGIAPHDLISLQQRLENSTSTQFQRYFLQLAAYPQRLSPPLLALLVNPAAKKEILRKWLGIMLTTDLRIIKEQHDAKSCWINAKNDILISNPQQHQADYILPLANHLDLAHPSVFATLKKVLEEKAI